MPTARIVGLPQTHSVVADPLSFASVAKAAETIGVAPGETFVIEFEDDARTYIMRSNLEVAYVGVVRRAASVRSLRQRFLGWWKS